MSERRDDENRRRRMSTIMKAFCVLGLIAGGLLCLFDWLAPSAFVSVPTFCDWR